MPTLLIVPAETDIAGQCRIVSHPDHIKGPLAHYRAAPEEWYEAGLMASNGKLRCLEGPLSWWNEIRECEPLMAGLTFYF